MNSTIILAVNWFLIAAVIYTAAKAAWTISTKGHKPVRNLINALITALLCSFVITMWNTDIPVWLWWIAAAILGVTGFLATANVLTSRSAKRAE